MSIARILPICFLGGLLTLTAGHLPKANLSLKNADGQRVKLSDYRSKVVVLNFWATWCVPCAQEIPMLVKAEKDYGPRGVTFIAASVDDRKSRKNVPDFVSKYHVGFSVLLDATTTDLLRLGMGSAVPATAFLDKEGHIVSRVQGQLHEEELKERLEWLLGNRTRPAPQRVVRHP